MKIIEEPLPGLLLIEPKVFRDARGYFFESFSSREMESLGIKVPFVQDNQSLSQKGVLRGLHFQGPPAAQDKLVRVISGAVLDVAVDVRQGSPTYGRHFAVELSGDNFLMLFIPKGFAHGFETLEDNTVFSYKCSDYYRPDTEGGLRWDDPDVNIAWRGHEALVSDKDQKLPGWEAFESPFEFGAY
ncbi:MAG: dTDP-4-dehydrorhamnose 3,5-epimerase [Bacteroidetes bacterium]|nr:dTDP-4-dehydrorhamnose 3,5-epimerase [Bacteroidota bacterium]